MTRRQKRELKRAIRNKKNIIIAAIIATLAIVAGKALLENAQYEAKIAEMQNEVSTLTNEIDELVDDTHALYEEVCEKYAGLTTCL